MPALFDKLGIRFDYPENWTLEEEITNESEEDTSEIVQVVVSSPQTAYWHLCKHPTNVELESLFDEGLAALRVQYPNMEVEIADDFTPTGAWFEHQQDVAQDKYRGPLLGYNVNFICLDLTVTAWLRGIQTDNASYFLFCQAEDRELANAGLVFRAMWISLMRNESINSVKANS